MNIKQLSIFVENKEGRLAQITGILAAKGINILALSIADTTDFGILRIIVEDPDQAYEVLKEAGVMVKATDVVAISLEHKAGSLHEALNKLNEEGIQIEYMYHFSCQLIENESIIVLRLNKQEQAVEIMKKCGIKIVNSDIINGI